MSAANDLISAAAGMIFEHAGFDEPAGFKWANGQALGRAAYPKLFAALTKQITGTTTNASTSVTGVSADLTASVTIGMPISGTNIQAGTTVAGITANTITLSQNATSSATLTLTIAPHGVGDGSTTFNVPDKRGRVAVGRDNMGGTAANRLTTAAGGVNGVLLGHAAGTEAHALTTAQLAAHNHGVFLNDPGHAHSTSALYFTGANNIAGGSTANINIQGLASNTQTTGITVRDTTGGGGTANQTAGTGTGAAHPNVQPSIVCNFVIKT